MPVSGAAPAAGYGDWVLPSVAMLGFGGLFFHLAKSDASSAEPSLSRREALAAGAAAAFIPLAANADGASSIAVKEKSRAVYGSRVYRLKGATAERVLEEKNTFTLFITGAYRNGDLDTQKKLKGLEKDILKAAKAGDTSAAQASINEFIKVGKIRELDTVAGGNFDPRQRRNPGAPATSEIEAQMGPASYSLYQPLKPGAPAAKK
jgi:hypothetical protein